MKKISVMLVMMLIMIIFTVGIASAGDKKPGDYPVNTTVVIIGDSSVNEPEAIEISPGEYLKVVLYAAGGTGYGWVLDSDSLTSIEVVSSNVAQVNSQPLLVGGKARWDFTCT